MVSAPLKILIERLQPYYTYFYKNNKKQKIEKRRKAFIIATSGRDGKEALDFIEKQFKYTFSVTNIELLGSVLCNYTDTQPKVENAEKEILSIIERIG
jgi:multimeric flavodoxin WrbA